MHLDYCLARFCSTQTYYHTADAHLPCTYGLCAPVLPQLPFSWRPGGFSCPNSITLLTCLARTEKADGKSRRQTNREKNIQAQPDYEARSGLILDPFKKKHHELRIQAQPGGGEKRFKYWYLLHQIIKKWISATLVVIQINCNMILVIGCSYFSVFH